jgi:hypothetical protein
MPPAHLSLIPVTFFGCVLKYNNADDFFFSVSSTAEERQPYIQQSQVDKKRYEKESAEYRAAAAPVDVDSD